MSVTPKRHFSRPVTLRFATELTSARPWPTPPLESCTACSGRQSDLLHRVRGLRPTVDAAFGSGLGSWMAFVALNLQVWDLTHSGTWIAALLIADFLPAIAIGLTVGPLVDRLWVRE